MSTSAERQRKQYWTNPEKRRQRNRAYRARARLQLIEKFSGKCIWCGETDTELLEFDHIHNDGAKEPRTQNNSSGRSNGGRSTLAKVRKAPERFQLLCKACNLKKRNWVNGWNVTTAARPLLLIAWFDHTSEGAWADADKFHGPSLCYSIGWLCREDDGGITISADISPTMETDSHSTGRLQYILKSCIVGRDTLKCPKL